MTTAPPKRYVITGAEGFIGSAVVRAALDSAAHVTAVCFRDPWRLAALRSNEIAPVFASDMENPGFAEEFRNAVASADALIHLGYQPPSKDLDSTERLAFELSVNARAVAELADIAGDTPIVFASSADVYGSWHDETVDETTPPNPTTPYAVAKLEAESALGHSSTILRISTVYGPGELVPRAVPSFIKACLSGGTAVLHGGGIDVKDYVPVEAVAHAFVAAAQRPAERRRILNISSGIGRSTADVLDTVIRVVDSAPSRVENVPSPRSPSRLVVSPELARVGLDFAPTHEFEAGLAEEAAWLDTNRSLWE